jgi:hypothetical protein
VSSSLCILCVGVFFEISCVVTVYILDKAQKIGHLKGAVWHVSELRDMNSNLQHLQINLYDKTEDNKSRDLP